MVGAVVVGFGYRRASILRPKSEAGPGAPTPAEPVGMPGQPASGAAQPSLDGGCRNPLSWSLGAVSAGAMGVKPDRLESLRLDLSVRLSQAGLSSANGLQLNKAELGPELYQKLKEEEERRANDPQLHAQLDLLIAQGADLDQRRALTEQMPQSLVAGRSPWLRQQLKGHLSDHRNGKIDDEKLASYGASLLERAGTPEQIKDLKALIIVHLADRRRQGLVKEVTKVMRTSDGLSENELKDRILGLLGDTPKPLEVAFVCSLAAAYRALHRHLPEAPHA